MVFSSVPAYLDPPIWLHHHQSESGADHENAHVPPLLPPPPPLAPLPARGGGGGGGGGSGTACTDTSKPDSMSIRAKLAKLSGQPDPALKCPRCESTNTKFCYFNNYNLSQPRHFCKTCRRYWTRGGALRNVPVGGGCRRNKRSKSGSSRTKSPATSLGSISALLIPNSSCTTDHNLCHLTLPPPKLPFLPSLHHLTDHYGTFGGIHNANGSTTTAGNDIDHLIQIGSSYSNGKFADNWRMHQSPFLETPNTGIYQFEMSEGASNYGGAVTSDYLGTRAVDSGATQAVVEGVPKMEDNSTYPGRLNLSKKLLGNQSETENQYYSWAGINSNAWINASHDQFASSSTSHVL